MIMRRVAQWLGAGLGLALILGAGGLAVLTLDGLGGVRNRIAAALLSRYAGEERIVRGPVSVALGASTTVSVAGVRAPDAADDAPDHGLRISFPISDALRGHLRPTALALSGFRLSADGGDRSAGDPLGDRVADIVTAFLAGSLSRDLTFEDVSVVRAQDPDGWTFDMLIDRATARATADGTSIAIDMSGAFNGAAFALTGTAPRPGAQDDAVQLDLRVAGLSARLDGQLTHGASGATLTGTVAAESESLGDLLDTLRLARELEGAATFQGSLAGPLAALSLSDATLDAASAAGPELALDGSVDDIWAGDGLDLRFDLTRLAGPEATEVAPRRIDGRLEGAAAAMTISDLAIETGLASVDLRRVGPISVARVERSSDGRLRLDGIRLVQGDPARPAIDLSADLADVLGLRGLTASADFDLDLASLLGVRGDLGTLRGSLGLSDASGSLALTAFGAQTASDAPLRLALQRSEDGRLKVDLGAPDIARLAEAAGLARGAGGALAYKGTVEARESGWSVDGMVQIAKTLFDSHLAIVLDGAAPRATGALRTERLYAESIATARAAAEILAVMHPEGVAVDPDVASNAALSLDFAANVVSTAEIAHALEDVSAHLALEDAHLRLDPFSARVLGGRIDGALTARLDTHPTPLSVEGKARGVDMARLQALAGRPAAVSGPVDIDLSVDTAAGPPSAMLAGLTGNVSASIYGGRLASDALNLAGESILSWAVSQQADGGAPLVCLVVALDFEGGVGHARKMVMETDKVQLVGGGELNLRDGTIALNAVPRAKQSSLVGSVGPVAITGALANPQITLQDGAVAGKLLGDTLGAPFRLLGHLLPGAVTESDRTPCVVHEMAGER